MATSISPVTLECDSNTISSDDTESGLKIEGDDPRGNGEAAGQTENEGESTTLEGDIGPGVKTETANMDNEFSTKTWREDLTLIVEGKQLYVTSGVLYTVSPEFSSMLESIFKKEGPRTLELPGSYADMVEFLRCIHPAVMKPVSGDTVLRIAPLAHTYKIERLEKACEEIMLEMITSGASLATLCHMFKVASSCHMASLKEKCTVEISKHRESTIYEAMDKVQLSADDRVEISEWRNKKLDEEVHNLQVCVKQTENRCSDVEYHLKRSWMENLKIYYEAAVDLRCIDLLITEDQRIVSRQIHVRHVAFTIGTCIVNEYHREYLTFTIKADGDRTWRSWKCNIMVSCRIDDVDGIREWRRKQADLYDGNNELDIYEKQINDFKGYPLEVNLVVLVANVSCDL